MNRIRKFALALAAAAFASPCFAQQTPAPAESQPGQQTPAAQPAPAGNPPAAGAPQMTPDMQAKMEAWTKASTIGAQQAQLADQLVGNWALKTTMWMDPSMPPMESTGTSVNTSEFGGRHIRSKVSGTAMGQPFSGEALTSYDNTKGKFISTWFDSMGTGQYMTEGDYDPATRTYTFTGTMSDPTKPGKTTKMKDTLKFTDKDHYTMESYEIVDGKENRMMQVEYTRAAP